MEDLTIEVRGRKFPVEVVISNGGKAGEFKTDFDGTPIRRDTWEALYDALMEATRKSGLKLDIPLTYVDRDRMERGTIYAVHGGSGNPMVRWESGSKTELTSWRGGAILASMSDEEMARGEVLMDAEKEALRKLNAWKDEHSFDLRKTLAEELGQS